MAAVRGRFMPAGYERSATSTIGGTDDMRCVRVREIPRRGVERLAAARRYPVQPGRSRLWCPRSCVVVAAGAAGGTGSIAQLDSCVWWFARFRPAATRLLGNSSHPVELPSHFPCSGRWRGNHPKTRRSAEHTSEIQSLMPITYAVHSL